MSIRSLLRASAVLTLALALALPLAACGKKGAPQAPDGAEDSVYPRTYPSR